LLTACNPAPGPVCCIVKQNECNNQFIHTVVFRCMHRRGSAGQMCVSCTPHMAAAAQFVRKARASASSLGLAGTLDDVNKFRLEGRTAHLQHCTIATAHAPPPRERGGEGTTQRQPATVRPAVSPPSLAERCCRCDKADGQPIEPADGHT
jgi:hypothetical protein